MRLFRHYRLNYRVQNQCFSTFLISIRSSSHKLQLTLSNSTDFVRRRIFPFIILVTSDNNGIILYSGRQKNPQCYTIQYKRFFFVVISIILYFINHNNNDGLPTVFRLIRLFFSIKNKIKLNNIIRIPAKSLRKIIN